MFRDSLIAAIRTGVATLVGIAIAWLVNVGVAIPDDFQSSLNAVLVAAIVLGYNFAVGYLERRVNPLFGVLLGVPKAPAYGSVGTATPAPKDARSVDWALAVSQPADKVPGYLRARDERGSTNLIGTGVVALLVGVVVAVLFSGALGSVGYAVAVVGAVAALVGVVLLFVRGSDRV